MTYWISLNVEILQLQYSNLMKLLLFKQGFYIEIISPLFANDPGDLDSIPGHIIPKTLKWYLIPPSLKLSNIRWLSRVKWSSLGKGVAPSATPWCSSYWKGGLLVALDYGRQHYTLHHQFQNKKLPPMYFLLFWVLLEFWNFAITILSPFCIGYL